MALVVAVTTATLFRLLGAGGVLRGGAADALGELTRWYDCVMLAGLRVMLLLSVRPPG